MTGGLQNKKLIFLFILVQTILAITGGLLCLYQVTENRIPGETYVGNIAIGGLTRIQAEQRLEEKFVDRFLNGDITLRYNGIQDFIMKFSELDAALDARSSVAQIFGGKSGKQLKELVDGKILSKKRTFSPVVVFNEAKLVQKLGELAAVIHKEPVNANIYLKEDKLVKVPEIQGYKLDIPRMVKRVSAEMTAVLGEAAGLELDIRDEVESVKPDYLLKDFEGVEEVVSQYSTEITASEWSTSVKLAASSIHKVLLQPADISKGIPAGEFSFNKYLGSQSGLLEQNNEGYNQVVSTLHAAVLFGGIRNDQITRVPHPTPVEYIESGLDARVFGNSVDFKFKNTLDYPLVIFAQVQDNKITVTLASKKKDSSHRVSIVTDVLQRFDPPVISVENQDLKQGERKLISPGVQGMDVNVYQVILQDHVQINKKLLYTDRYRPIQAVWQMGPNTQWENPAIK